jgi:signal peptidase
MALTTKLPGKDKSLFGYKFLSVTTSSMEPKINTGSLIIINKNVDYSKLEVGDIITYRSPQDYNMLITHRINEINVKNSTVKYLTKGDNNKYIDNYYIKSYSILGKYENISFKNLGYVLDYLKSKKGTFLILVVPIIFLFSVHFIYNFVKLIKFDLHNKCKEDIFI